MPGITISTEDHQRIMAESTFSGLSPGGVVHQALDAVEELERCYQALCNMVGQLAVGEPFYVGFDDTLGRLRTEILRLRELTAPSQLAPSRDHIDDKHDHSERDAIAHEPKSVWTLLRHPAL